jgi:hypothetical protein
MLRPHLRVSAVTLALVLLAGAAAAQEVSVGSDAAFHVTMGKAMLDEGRQLVREGHLKEACERLEASVRHDPTPTAMLDLAGCQEKLGATASAWGTLHRAEERARTLGDKTLADDAVKRARALEPLLSRIRVVVAVGKTPPHVFLDDRSLASEAWGVPLPLDPGPHTVSARSPGETPFSTTFDLPAWRSPLDVLVPELGAPTPPPAPAPPAKKRVPTSEPSVPTSPSPSPPAPATAQTDWHPGYIPHRRNLTWVAVGLFSGGLGSAVLAGLVVYVDARNMSNSAVIGTLVFGGVSLVPGTIGAILGVVDPQHVVLRNSLPFQVGPFVARSGGGASLHGAF